MLKHLQHEYCAHLPPLWRAKSLAFTGIAFASALAMSLCLFLAYLARKGFFGDAIGDSANSSHSSVAIFAIWAWIAAAAFTARWFMFSRPVIRDDGTLPCGACGQALVVPPGQETVRCPECGAAARVSGLRSFWFDWSQARARPRSRAFLTIELAFLVATLITATAALVGAALGHEPIWIKLPVLGAATVLNLWAVTEGIAGGTRQTRSKVHWQRQVEGT